MKKKKYPTKRLSKLKISGPKVKPAQKKLSKKQIEDRENELLIEDLKNHERIHAQQIREGLFINEYILDFNGTQAAIRAGFTENAKSAGVIAARLLAKVSIQQDINERLRQRSAVQKVDSDYVLEALIENHKRCSQAVPVLDGDGAPTGVWKFDAKGSNKALELIGRHLELFPTNVKHSNDPKNPLPEGGSQVVFYVPNNGRLPTAKPKTAKN